MLIKLQNSEKEVLELSRRQLDSRLDNPIDKKTNKTLTTTWLARYSYRLHPTQEGTRQILGSMWRSLMNRQITTDKCEILAHTALYKGHRTKEANPQNGRMPNASQ